MLDSNLIKSFYGISTTMNQNGQEPERKTEDNQDQESIIEEQVNGNEICDTRDNSEVNNSFVSRRISNPSVFDASFEEDSESSDLSENGDKQHYYSETIKYLKKLHKAEFDYSKSKNFMTKKDYKKFIENEISKKKLEKQNLKDNRINKPIYINYPPFCLINCQILNTYGPVPTFYNPFLGYHWAYFSTKSIIPNGNTEKCPVMPQDKKDDCRNLKEGSTTKKEESKIDEPKVDDIEIEEYIPKYQRIKNKKKFNAKNNRNNHYKKGNNYNYNNRNNYRQSNYFPNKRYFRRSNKSEC